MFLGSQEMELSGIVGWHSRDCRFRASSRLYRNAVHVAGDTVLLEVFNEILQKARKYLGQTPRLWHNAEESQAFQSEEFQLACLADSPLTWSVELRQRATTTFPGR